MAEFSQDLEALLRRRFRGPEVEIDPTDSKAMVSGVIAWRGFDRVPPIDRQRQLSRVLKEHLREKDFNRVGTILAFTIRESISTGSKKLAYRTEGDLLKQYFERHGELPPLNYKFNWTACN